MQTKTMRTISTDYISDYLQAALLLSSIPSEIVGEAVQTDHLYDAVNVILSLQVKNGFSD